MKRILMIALLSLGPCLCANSQRLPDAVVPESYDLKFVPDLTKATFTGEETIDINVVKPASTIILNAAELEFQQATVTALGATRTAKVTLDAAKDQLVLRRVNRPGQRTFTSDLRER